MHHPVIGWDQVRIRQDQAGAVIRELHREIDRGIIHTPRPGSTRVEVVHGNVSSVPAPPVDTAASGG